MGDWIRNECTKIQLLDNNTTVGQSKNGHNDEGNKSAYSALHYDQRGHSFVGTDVGQLYIATQVFIAQSAFFCIFAVP